MSLVAKALALIGAATILAATDMGLRPTPILTPAFDPSVELPPQDVAAPEDVPNESSGTAESTPRVPQVPTPAPAKDPFEGMAVTLAEAYALYETGAQMIDARPESEFRNGHIAMAMHGPSDKISEVLQLVPKEMDIVIYCTGGDCHASHDVALLLKHAGYTKLHIMTDGFDAWKSAGYDVE